MTTKTKSPDTGRVPGSKWKFDGGVTKVFDDMLRRSIPEHDRMREATFAIGRRHVRHGSTIYDLGCSRGEALAPFVAEFARKVPDVRFHGYEISKPMVAAARSRFKEYGDTVTIHEHDIRTSTGVHHADLVLSVLTLQFVPINYRARIVRDVYNGIRFGGALLLVEKVLGNSPEIDEAMISTYHEMKMANGYSPDDVRRKSLALEGVLVPLSERWNRDLLSSAGFREVDCYWRWMNFAAWIAVK